MNHLDIFVEFAQRNRCRATARQIRFFSWKLDEAIKAHPAKLVEKGGITIQGVDSRIVTFWRSDGDRFVSTNFISVEINRRLSTIYVVIGNEAANE